MGSCFWPWLLRFPLFTSFIAGGTLAVGSYRISTGHRSLKCSRRIPEFPLVCGFKSATCLRTLQKWFRDSFSTFVGAQSDANTRAVWLWRSDLRIGRCEAGSETVEALANTKRTADRGRSLEKSILLNPPFRARTFSLHDFRGPKRFRRITNVCREITKHFMCKLGTRITKTFYVETRITKHFTWKLGWTFPVGIDLIWTVRLPLHWPWKDNFHALD